MRRGRRQAAEQNENAPECLSHGPGWKDRFEQLIDSLVGKVLADRQGLKLELASVVCSCDERNREKCRDAARRFGFTIGKYRVLLICIHRCICLCISRYGINSTTHSFAIYRRY